MINHLQLANVNDSKSDTREVQKLLAERVHLKLFGHEFAAVGVILAARFSALIVAREFATSLPKRDGIPLFPEHAWDKTVGPRP